MVKRVLNGLRSRSNLDHMGESNGWFLRLAFTVGPQCLVALLCPMVGSHGWVLKLGPKNGFQGWVPNCGAKGCLSKFNRTFRSQAQVPKLGLKQGP